MKKMRNRTSRLLQAFACVLCIAVFDSALLAAPPTVDPTYGLPLPAQQSAVAPSPDANWIWADQTSNHQTVYLAKTFTLQIIPASAILYVTGDDFFAGYVNGTSIIDAQPTDGSDNQWSHVHRVDITHLLTSGSNRLALKVTNVGGPAGALARLEADGKPILLTDSTWRFATTTPTTDDWTKPGFDDGSWKPVRIVAPIGGDPWGDAIDGWPLEISSSSYLKHLTLKPQKVEVLNEASTISGADLLSRDQANVDVHSSRPAILLDFGKEITGRVCINGTPSSKVEIATGESREECLGTPWLAPRTAVLNGTRHFDKSTAFRFAKISFPEPGDTQLTEADADMIYYPVQYLGSFDCSDPLLTRIWYTGAYTCHLCMQRDIWDAPKRDRFRWSGDLHISGEVINNVFADRFLMEQTLRRLYEDVRSPQGDSYPPRDHINGIPGYTSAWICTLADFHRHIGDYDFLKKQHDALISMLEYQRGDLDDRNLFQNKHGAMDFVDWSPLLDGNGVFTDHTKEPKDAQGNIPERAATQFFLVKAAREASFLLNEMGDMQNAEKYARWADTLTVAARQYLFDPKAGDYSGLRQVNARAIYSGVATSGQISKIYDRVLRPGVAAWDAVASPYYNNYVLLAMNQAGHNADALNFIRSYWGGMLDEGATTFWEGYDPRWEKDHPHAHLQADDNSGYVVSLCHGWSCGPTNYLTERVLGVRSIKAAFATAIISPNLGDLQWAQGDVPTPRGLLHVRAEKHPDGVAIEISLPPQTQALVPADHAIQLDGLSTEPIQDASGSAVRITMPGMHHVFLPASR